MITDYSAFPPGELFYVSDKYPMHAVTHDGRVFSLIKRRYLRPMRCGKYLAVGVKTPSGGTVRRYVHRLVLELATGILPDGYDACHNDGNPFNNCADNLRWDTRAQNHADKRLHGTAATGEKNPRSRLTNASALEIRARALRGEQQNSIAKEFNVSPMTVSRLVRGQSWAHI